MSPGLGITPDDQEYDKMEGRVINLDEMDDADTLATVQVSLANSYGEDDIGRYSIFLQGSDELPTLDDECASSASSSSSSSSEGSELNIKTSFLSNTLFLLGSALTVWLALWDLWNQEKDYLEDELEDDYSSSSDSDDSEVFWNNYNILSVISALFLIGNSLVDIVWSIKDANYDRGRHFRMQRRSKLRIGAAITFGIAACCDLTSVFYQDDDDEYPSYYISTAAVHVYFVNAVLAVVADKPSCAYLSSALTASGDILFLIASIIDMVLSYFGAPAASTGTVYAVGIANLISSLLWVVDAKLYIAADLIEMEDIRLTRLSARRNRYRPPPLQISLSQLEP